MTEDELTKAQGLIDRLEADAIQTKLKPGFERDFSNSIIEQWNRNKRLSARQLELLEDILNRHDNTRPRSSFGSRRYEGHR